MRLLLLTHRIPYPPNKGDKIRSFNITQYLARRHEVHLGTLIDDAADADSLPILESGLAGRVLHARIDQPGRKALAVAQIARSSSITVGHFYSRRMQRQIDNLIDVMNVDAVVCSSSPMAEYLFMSRHVRGKLRSAIKVMDLIDVDSYKWGQYADRSPGWSRWVYRYEAERLASYERKIYREFDRIIVVSEQEKGYFPAKDTDKKLSAISNGVDLDFFHPLPDEPSKSSRPTLVFTGTMDYWPNVEGLRWFITQIYPVVRKAVPDVRLLIVGGRPTREVRSWGRDESIVVTGFVDDIRDYLAAADVCIAPLRIARGIQNKVLEAMAMGKAVICTPEAFESVNAIPGRDLLVADSVETFARQTAALLGDRERAAGIGRSARARIEACYAWERNLGLLDEIVTGSVTLTS